MAPTVKVGHGHLLVMCVHERLVLQRFCFSFVSKVTVSEKALVLFTNFSLLAVRLKTKNKRKKRGFYHREERQQETKFHRAEGFFFKCFFFVNIFVDSSYAINFLNAYDEIVFFFPVGPS